MGGQRAWKSDGYLLSGTVDGAIICAYSRRGSGAEAWMAKHSMGAYHIWWIFTSDPHLCATRNAEGPETSIRSTNRGGRGHASGIETDDFAAGHPPKNQDYR